MGEHIPKFKNREEESEFWQTTDIDQLAPGMLQETSVERPGQPKTVTFAIRLDRKTIAALRQIARAEQVGPTQLVRAWILDRLRIERSVGALADPATEYPREFELVLRRKVLDALMESLPHAAEQALQEVLDRADQEIRTLRESV